MTHSATLIRQLDTTTRRQLLQKSDRAGFIQLLLHIALLTLSSALVMSFPTFRPVTLILHGILLMFLFCAQHECIHYTAFASRRINTLCAWVIGLLLLVPPTWFRYFHMAHHRFTNQPDRDPELASAKPSNRAQLFWHLTGLPTWYSLLKSLVNSALKRHYPSFIPTDQRSTITNEARVFIAIYLTAAMGSLWLANPILLLLWVIPALLGQPFLRAFLLAEHTLCPASDDMLENTRTTLTTRLIRLISWNMPFHTEHHALPSVPFHRLPLWHRHLRASLMHCEDGYTHFHRRYYRELRHVSL